MNKRQKLPFHTNGMRFTAYDAAGEVLATRDYYSVGGGFVVNQDEAAEDRIVADTTELPYPFHSGAEAAAAVRDARQDDGAADVRQRTCLAFGRGDPPGPARASGRRCRTAWRAASARKARCPAACMSPRRAPGAVRRTVATPGSGDARPAHRARLGQPLRARGERGKRRRWPRRHRARPMARPASFRRCCTTTTASARARTSRACSTSC